MAGMVQLIFRSTLVIWVKFVATSRLNMVNLIIADSGIFNWLRYN
jgi:hypothetical protein